MLDLKLVFPLPTFLPLWTSTAVPLRTPLAVARYAWRSASNASLSPAHLDGSLELLVRHCVYADFACIMSSRVCTLAASPQENSTQLTKHPTRTSAARTAGAFLIAAPCLANPRKL